MVEGITVRNLDDQIKRRLRLGAAALGKSMEQEAREILRGALADDPAPTQNLGSVLHALFLPYADVELEIPPPEPMREPPQFR